MKLIVAALLTTFAMSAAHAQTIYRCANAYSQAPCPQAKLIEVSDDRSPAQRAEARRVADDEHRMAAEMRHERLADERVARSGAASLSGQAPVKVVALTPDHPHKKKHAFVKAPATSDFVAFDPSSRKRRNRE